MNRARAFAGIGLCVVLYVAHALVYWFTCDDAYISFRYARHLAEGHGLVFNVGEAPPVEGYSNLLWVLLLAPCSWLGLSLEWCANLLSLACGAVLVGWSARRAGLAAGWLLALCPAFALWGTAGLETMPFALLLFASYERMRAGALGAASLCACAATLMRVDGAAFALLVLALGGLGQWRRTGFAILAVLLCLGALLWWRTGFYGEWLPNTAYAKSELSALTLERGAKYLASFLLAFPALLLGLMAAFVLALRARASARAVWAPLAILAATLAHGLLVGGDFMPMGRFFVPGLAFLALALGTLLRSRAGWTVLLALSPLASFDLTPLPESWRETLHFRWNDPRWRSEKQQWQAMRQRSAEWLELGQALARFTRPGESLIVGNIGAIGYACELFLYDQFGLTSREVARTRPPPRRVSAGHDKGVRPDFFFERRPTYLGAWIGPASAAPDPVQERMLRSLPGAPPLELVRHPLEDGSGRVLNLWRLKWE
jgi:hypothetical protein